MNRNNFGSWFQRPSSAIALAIQEGECNEALSSDSLFPNVVIDSKHFHQPVAVVYQIPSVRDISAIDEYAGLSQDWDGYDADPISDAACQAARKFLVSMPGNLEAPELSPNPNGTISMEWDTSDGEAQLEIGRTRYSFFLRKRGAKTIYQKGELQTVTGVAALLTTLRKTYRPSNINSIEY